MCLECEITFKTSGTTQLSVNLIKQPTI